MKTARWLPAAAATFALGSGGFVYAQTGATGVHKAEDKSVMVMPYNVTIDDLEDMDIYGPDGKEIGEVDSVLVDAAAKPVAIAAEVGGFLGLGEKDVIIGLERLTKEGDHLKVDMTKEQIAALPDFDD
jgi:sporulation protein YlmC with PRC-barrel domain